MLWTTALLSLIGTRTFAASGRAQARLAAEVRDAAVTQAAADGAVQEAAFHLLETPPQRWAANGIKYLVAMPGGVAVEVRVESEEGKVTRSRRVRGRWPSPPRSASCPCSTAPGSGRTAVTAPLPRLHRGLLRRRIAEGDGGDVAHRRRHPLVDLVLVPAGAGRVAVAPGALDQGWRTRPLPAPVSFADISPRDRFAMVMPRRCTLSPVERAPGAKPR